MPIDAVQFTNNPYNVGRRKETTEDVAMGAGVGTYAAHKASKSAAMKAAMGKFSSSVATTQRNAKEVTGLWGKFQNDIKRFSGSLMHRMDKLKNAKFIGAIIKNPAVRYATRGLGVVMAFFALITGVSKAIRNGRLAVGDLKDRFSVLG